MNPTPEVKESKPSGIVHQETTRGVQFKIYRTETRKGDRVYPGFTLVYYAAGVRKRELSANLEGLKARIPEVLKDIEDGHADTLSMRRGEREEYLAAIQAIARTGQPLRVAATHYAKAVEILGADLVVTAALEYAKRHLQQITPRLVADAVTEMLAEKERAKKSERHLGTLRSHLTRFKDSFSMNIAEVTADAITAFLDALKDGERPVSPRTRDNYRNSISTLMEWAKIKRYVPDDYSEVDRVARLSSDEDGEITIYRPAELEAFLSVADAKLVPFLAIGAFAGLRSSEIMRLDWSDVRLENGEPHIVVGKGKVKKRGKSRRVVSVSPNLKAWLAPHAKKEGRVWPFSTPYLYEMLRELAPKAQVALQKTEPEAKLEWKSNALRHSFISYRVALIKNVPEVALEAGNSPQMIFSNYRELVTDSAAAEWFNLHPKA